MIPFPGESIGIGGSYEAVSSIHGDADLWKKIRNRGDSGYGLGSSQAIVPGETWWCWVYDSTYSRPYLEEADDDTPLTVSWVIEVIGGAGVLHLSDTLDSGWSYATPSVLENDLGTVQINGPGTYTVATTRFTNQQIRTMGWDIGPSQVCITCVSGSVSVQQVKMRVWPVGGPVGYWSTNSVTDEPMTLGPTEYRQQNSGIFSPPSGNYADQGAFRAVVDAAQLAAPVPTNSSTTQFAMSAFHSQLLYPSGDTPTGGTAIVGYYRFTDYSFDPSDNLALNRARNPQEVKSDLREVQYPTVGSPVVSWDQGVLTGVQYSNYASNYPQGSYHVTVTAVPQIDPAGTPFKQLILGNDTVLDIPSRGPNAGSNAFLEQSITLPLPTVGQLYRVVVWHDGFLEAVGLDAFPDPDPDGGTGGLDIAAGYLSSPGGSPDPLRITWQPAPYRYWDPNGVPPEGGPGTGWDNQWGDWYVPGWGNWDWFPDYDWDANPDYPDYPDYNDYYIPLPSLPTYHYLPFDLNTNTQLGEIPLEDVTYSHKLSAPGTASFSIPVTPEMLRQQIKQSSTPGRTGIYVVRDNQIAWGGIIWKRQYDSSSRRVRFEAGSFESYFDHRFQSNVLGFEDVDQMTIARTLALQAADEMHIDVDPAVSGVNRYYNAFYYDFKTIGGELDGLASLWDGFDWNVRVYLDTNGIIRRRLVWGYPQLGVQAADTQLLFEYPGSIRSYTVTEDADKAGNRVWAIGGGQGLDQIQYEARDDAQLAAGWPLLETTTSYKDVFQPARLEARSKQDLERLRPPVTVLNVEVDPFSHPKLGTYNPGDWARFVIQDNWNNPGIDVKRRIVGYTVNISANSPLDRVSLDIDAGDTTG